LLKLAVFVDKPELIALLDLGLLLVLVKHGFEFNLDELVEFGELVWV
jgi:hypothetical protein